MSSSREVEYNKHQIQTRKFKPSSQMNAGAYSKVLKIFLTNPDGTDSFSHNPAMKRTDLSHAPNARKVISETRIEPLASGKRVTLTGS